MIPVSRAGPSRAGLSIDTAGGSAYNLAVARPRCGQEEVSALETAPTQRRLSPAAAVVLLVFALVLAVATVWLLRMPIQFFIIATLIALALSHPVNWLERRRVPRIVAVIGMLGVVIGAIAVLAGVFVPPLTRQAADLFDNLPTYWKDLQHRLQELTVRYPWIQQRISELDITRQTTRRLEEFLAAGWQVAVGVAGGIVLTVLLVITVAFMLSNPRPLVRGILSVVPEPWDERARQIGALVGDRIRAWLRGLVILGSIVGIMVGVGLWALGVPYAVLFGVLAGLLEMVPTVGPVLSALPPVLVAVAGEPIKALYVVLLFILVQQVENTLLVPFVMRRQLQLHPVSTIFGFIALGTLFGLFGAIVAVPTVAILKVLYDELYHPWAHPREKLERAAVSVEPVPAEESEPEDSQE